MAYTYTNLDTGIFEIVNKFGCKVDGMDNDELKNAMELLSDVVLALKEKFNFIRAVKDAVDVKSTKRRRGDMITDSKSPHGDSSANRDSLLPLQNLLEKGQHLLALWKKYNSMFEWVDGPLVTAMKYGHIFVLDEINLAEDAVIERLNSVLESGRAITIAEKGGVSEDESERLIAHPNFKIIATMNPSGDFGKRELSPALRSRFTEIFVQNESSEDNLIMMLTEVLQINTSSNECTSKKKLFDAYNIIAINNIAAKVVTFVSWLNRFVVENEVFSHSIKMITNRDLLAWANFIVLFIKSTIINSSDYELQVYKAYMHGAMMILLDGLSIGRTITTTVSFNLKLRCLDYLLGLCPERFRDVLRNSIVPPKSLTNCEGKENIFSIGEFSISMGRQSVQLHDPYVLNAQTTILNMWRIVRALQINRPILIEGPPGVGKSSIVTNLARISGHRLIRINLSEHSDISDLLGSDLPQGTDESSKAIGSNAKFVWCDGAFLTAMKEGHWVLLDELNLAPQSVLEGNNDR
jgi:midasin